MSFRENLGLIKGRVLVETLDGLMLRTDDEIHRAEIIDKFEKACPGLHELVRAFDKIEKAGGLETPKLDSEHELAYTPAAYGMLLGFIALKVAADETTFKRLFDV